MIWVSRSTLYTESTFDEVVVFMDPPNISNSLWDYWITPEEVVYGSYCPENCNVVQVSVCMEYYEISFAVTPSPPIMYIKLSIKIALADTLGC